MDCQLLPFQNKVLELNQISDTIIQNANFGVVVVDTSFRIMFFNQAACDILAIPATLIGSNLKQALRHLSSKSSESLLQAFSENSPSIVEVEIDKEIRTLEISANTLIGGKGIQEAIVFFLYDLTRKEKEHKQLQENLRMATLGSLASEMAHELKNPVTVIKGFSQLLLKKSHEDPQVMDFLEIIFKEAERAHLFIQDFLNLGKTKGFRRKPINPRNLITDAIAEIEKQCFLNEIEIVQQIEASCKVFGDWDQLKQALVNLGKNGVEAMEHSALPKILTFSLVRSPTSESLIIEVRDTGCGIPAQLEEKIIMPFFTTKKYGTGLGLSITKAIVDQHGGSLRFTSSSQGTTAIVELPCQGQ